MNNRIGEYLEPSINLNNSIPLVDDVNNVGCADSCSLSSVTPKIVKIGKLGNQLGFLIDDGNEILEESMAGVGDEVSTQ